MRRPSAVGGVAVALGLILATSAPVAAEILPNQQGNLRVDLTVTGYTAGSWEPFFGNVACEGLPENIEFGIGSGGSTGWLEMPTGLPCWLMDFWPGDPGDNAAWGDLQFSDTGPWVVNPGDEIVVDLTAERFYAGEWPPEPDQFNEIGFDVLTVDRVYLNRYGGITAEGRILCEPVDAAYGGDIVAGVTWSASQYAGRKSTPPITADYQGGRGDVCWTPGWTQPGTWISHPPITPVDGIAWIYSPMGKFGTGTILFTVRADAGYSFVEGQTFDPTGTWASYTPGCSDDNGDGFCVVAQWYNGWVQAALKPIRVR